MLKLNGKQIRNIHHLAHLVDCKDSIFFPHFVNASNPYILIIFIVSIPACKDKYLVFEFEDNYLVVLEREVATAASTCILKDYGIPSERSSDLMEPYLDNLTGNNAVDQDIGDSPVSNLEIGFDGLLWA